MGKLKNCLSWASYVFYPEGNISCSKFRIRPFNVVVKIPIKIRHRVPLLWNWRGSFESLHIGRKIKYSTFQIHLDKRKHTLSIYNSCHSFGKVSVLYIPSKNYLQGTLSKLSLIYFWQDKYPEIKDIFLFLLNLSVYCLLYQKHEQLGT